MRRGPAEPVERNAGAAASEIYVALALIGFAVAVPMVAALAGLTPLPLDHREGMLPWALEGGEGVGGGRVPDARTWDAMWWDGVAQFLSWRWVLGHALRQGQIPYWSPWSFCGQPFAANGQSACFYPPAVVLCWLLPAAQAIAWLWVLHTALAAGLTAWLGRRLGLGWSGAAAAGVTYATGGFMLAWAPVQSLMMSAAWLPGALVGVELALHERRVQGAVLMAVCLAMAVLAGHMQVAGYVWMATAAYAAGRVFFRWVRRKPAPWVPVAGGFALALALSACQWLPTAELGMLSPRGGEKPTEQGFAFAQALALKPVHLATLVWPAALGLPKRGDYAGFAFAEHFLGLGPMTFLLALVGLARIWRLRACGLMVLGVVFLLVGMGTPLAAFIYYRVPPLGLTAGFQRSIFVFCLAWAVAAGVGLDWTVGRLGGGRAGRGLVGDARRRRRSGLARTAVSTISGAVLAVQAVALIMAVLPLSRARLAERTTPATRWLAERAPIDWRVLAVTPRAAWRLRRRPTGLLPPNTGAAYGLRDVQGYDSLYPRAYRDAAAGWEGADPAPMTNGNMVLLEKVEARELGRLGVRYVLTAAPVGSPRLRKVAEFEGAGGSVYVYERTDFQPPYRLVAGGKVRGLAAGLGYGRISVTVPPGAAGKGGTVEIAETPYPGWRAYLDGRPAAWTSDPALPLVRQVSLLASAAPRRVDFIYWPTTAALGMFLTLVAVGLAVGLLAGRGGLGRRRARRIVSSGGNRPVPGRGARRHDRRSVGAP